MIIGLPAPWPVGFDVRAGLLVSLTLSTLATSCSVSCQSTSSTSFISWPT